MTATSRETVERIRRDPVWFCSELLAFVPWSKQREIMVALRDHRHVAVRSAHGVGKTAIAGRAALWFLAAFPRCRVITTAPTFHQVKNLLWREIRAGYHASGGFFGGELTATKLELDADWFALGLSTDRPERFQGHHAENLLLVVDEAAGVADDIFEAASGFMTGPGARTLLIGNPTRTSGYFFDAFHRARAFYERVSVSALDTPAFTGEEVPAHVLRQLPQREWVDEMRVRFGERSSAYQVRVLGEFPLEADDAVFSLADVEAAQARELVPGFPTVVAADIARFGSDETVIATRRGPRVRIATSYGGQDLMRTVGEIARVARKLRDEANEVPVLVVDDAGVGGGVVDRLRELGEFRVVAFNGGQTARERREYPNARSEAWFTLAEQIDGVDLDADELLAADLLAPAYTLDSQGRRVVEPKSQTKKRLGRSPDRADAVLMAFSVSGAPPGDAMLGRESSVPSVFRGRSALFDSYRDGDGSVSL